MNQDIAISPQSIQPAAILETALTAEVLKSLVDVVRQAQAAVMRKGHHYAVIPGCGDKPVLLKPGAEVIALAFQFAASYKVQQLDLGNGHREYTVTCDLNHRQSGMFIGQGLGTCSTMEGKYRFRAGEAELTAVSVPKEYWDIRKSDPSGAALLLKEAAQEAGYTGEKFLTKKDENGIWRIGTAGRRVEHDNPADYYNTCCKMAKKRAFVDAILTSTAASDVFTQDIEEAPHLYGAPKTAEPVAEQKNTGPAPQSRDVITKPQIRLLSRAAQNAGFDEDSLHAAILEHYNAGSIGVLTKRQASQVIEAIQSGQWNPESYQRPVTADTTSAMAELPF